MKKKLLAFLPLLAFLIVSCNKENNNVTPAHEHHYDTENVEWSWNELSAGGYSAKAIFSCDGCDENTEGHEVSVNATVTSQVISNPTCTLNGTIRYTAKATFNNQEFTATRDRGISDPNAHHYVEVVGDAYLKEAATCLNDAVYYKSCEHCHALSNETFIAANTKLAHNMTHHEAHNSTCSEHGNLEYWSCSICEKYYLDESGNNETTLEAVTLELSDHNYVNVQEDKYLKSAATCTEDAVYYKSCEYCEEKGVETFTVPNSKLGHNLVHHAAASSTCQEHGNLEYWICDRCDGVFLDEDGQNPSSLEEVTLPLAHNMTLHAGQEATCYAEGRKDYYTCSFESDDVLYKDEAGTETYADASELVIPKLEHEFDETNECIHCHETVQTVMGLEEATLLDATAPITLSDLGVKSGINIDTTEHIYANYSFSSKKAIDLWFEYDYELVNKDSWFYFYLFNQRDESGLIFRLQTNRTDDDGIVPGYVWTNNGAASGTTVPTSPTMHYLPRKSGVKSTTTNIIHVTAYCINEANNTFRCVLTGGVKGETQYYLSTNAEDKTNTPLSYDIELGADYFASGEHNLLRFSAAFNENVVLRDAESEEQLVVYKDSSGQILGKKSVESLDLVNYNIEGKTLLGWFDGSGSKVHADDEVNSKTVVKPAFADTTDKMVTLTDYGLEETLEMANGVHVISGPGIYPENGNTLDFYFTYKFVSAQSNDNYFVIGVPYDEVDEKTRVLLRINNSKDGSDTRLSGFIYGRMTPLGDAGATGTRFDSTVGFRTSQYEPLLVHVNVTDNGNNNIDYTVDFLNLVTCATFTQTRNVTFDVDYALSQEFEARNRLGIIGSTNCDSIISSVF